MKIEDPKSGEMQKELVRDAFASSDIKEAAIMPILRWLSFPKRQESKLKAKLIASNEENRFYRSL